MTLVTGTHPWTLLLRRPPAGAHHSWLDPRWQRMGLPAGAWPACWAAEVHLRHRQVAGAALAQCVVSDQRMRLNRRLKCRCHLQAADAAHGVHPDPVKAPGVTFVQWACEQACMPRLFNFLRDQQAEASLFYGDTTVLSAHLPGHLGRWRLPRPDDASG
jgi:hypothetical protein